MKRLFALTFVGTFLIAASPAVSDQDRSEETRPAVQTNRPQYGWTLGGFYTTGSTHCSAVMNPWTGGQTCPPGFVAHLLTTAVCNAADSSARLTYLCVR